MSERDRQRERERRKEKERKRARSQSSSSRSSSSRKKLSSSSSSSSAKPSSSSSGGQGTKRKLKLCKNCGKRDYESTEKLCNPCLRELPRVECYCCRIDFHLVPKQGNPGVPAAAAAAAAAPAPVAASRSAAAPVSLADQPLCDECTDRFATKGEPGVCKHCECQSAWTGDCCNRCFFALAEYGDPQPCERCQKTCAFSLPEEKRKKVDNQTLCFLCTRQFKRERNKTGVGAASNIEALTKEYKQQKTVYADRKREAEERLANYRKVSVNEVIMKKSDLERMTKRLAETNQEHLKLGAECVKYRAEIQKLEADLHAVQADVGRFSSQQNALKREFGQLFQRQGKQTLDDPEQGPELVKALGNLALCLSDDSVKWQEVERLLQDPALVLQIMDETNALGVKQEPVDQDQAGGVDTGVSVKSEDVKSEPEPGPSAADQRQPSVDPLLPAAVEVKKEEENPVE